MRNESNPPTVQFPYCFGLPNSHRPPFLLPLQAVVFSKKAPIIRQTQLATNWLVLVDK